jgi:hypothetical protein
VINSNSWKNDLNTGKPKKDGSIVEKFCIEDNDIEVEYQGNYHKRFRIQRKDFMLLEQKTVACREWNPARKAKRNSQIPSQQTAYPGGGCC